MRRCVRSQSGSTAFLALELAAARVKVLTPAQILERLGRSLDLLTSGAHDAPERQRALRGTVEWSHRLLAADEQRLFAQLAVFAGSFAARGGGSRLFRRARRLAVTGGEEPRSGTGRGRALLHAWRRSGSSRWRSCTISSGCVIAASSPRRLLRRASRRNSTRVSGCRGRVTSAPKSLLRSSGSCRAALRSTGCRRGRPAHEGALRLGRPSGGSG